MTLRAKGKPRISDREWHRRRAVIMSLRVEGFKDREIATIMNLSQGHVNLIRNWEPRECNWNSYMVAVEEGLYDSVIGKEKRNANNTNNGL